MLPARLTTPPSPPQVFNHGFKCTRKFKKRLFPWDVLERVSEQLLSEAPPNEEGQPPSPDPVAHAQHMFINAVNRINSNNPNIGKEEKVRMCLCVCLCVCGCVGGGLIFKSFLLCSIVVAIIGTQLIHICLINCCFPHLYRLCSSSVWD